MLTLKLLKTSREIGNEIDVGDCIAPISCHPTKRGHICFKGSLGPESPDATSNERVLFSEVEEVAML